MQPYTAELLQPWVDSARKRGLRDIAFTDHDRYRAGIDFDEIDKLREKNVDLKIRAGIELDNDPVNSAAGRKWVEKHWDKLDFVLGSVHFLERDDQMFDSVPAGAAQFADRDIDVLYADYFRRVREIAATGLVDCLAHIDLIKVHGHRANADVGALIGETLDLIRSRNLAIELSTAGWRKPVNELYPSDRIIELAVDRIRCALVRAARRKFRSSGGEDVDPGCARSLCLRKTQTPDARCLGIEAAVSAANIL